MSDWATRKLEELEEKEAHERQQSLNDAVRFQRLYAEAPLLWDSLRNVLGANVSRFNEKRRMFNYQEPSGAVDTRNVSIARFDGQRHLRIVYYNSAMRTVFELYEARASSIIGTKKAETEYVFDLNGEEVWFKRRSDGQFFNVHDVASEWLNQLLD